MYSTHLRDLRDTYCVLVRNTEHKKHSLASSCKGQSEKNAFAERGYITSINPPPLPHHLPLLICFLNHLGVETNNDCACSEGQNRKMFSPFYYNLSPFPSFSLPPQTLRHQTTACSCCLWWWKEHSREVNPEHFLFSYLFCWSLFVFLSPSLKTSSSSDFDAARDVDTALNRHRWADDEDKEAKGRKRKREEWKEHRGRARKMIKRGQIRRQVVWAGWKNEQRLNR